VIDMTVGVGVIGAGVMGSAHVRTIVADVTGATVVSVSDADAARAATVGAEVPGCAVALDPYALIGDPAVDAVVVASSDETHEAFVTGCLDAGKPVLCEKPLAATAEASLRLVEAEALGGRRLVSVGFMRRQDPGYVALKAALGRGEVGGPLMVHCAHRNAGVPAFFTSEMLITSSAIHEIDVARWLLGEEIVSATVHTPRSTAHAPDGLRDPQFVVLESEGGVLIDVEVYVNAVRGYEIRCEVVGESGSLLLEESPIAPDFRGRFAAAYRHELQAWVDAVAAGIPFGPSAWDGYAANVVADACLESLARGGSAEVRLPARPELYGLTPGRVA
jgi:myo-inositol 2-dehydrogenase/D-chiro-inositol 1-dehydrogenase